MTRSLGPPTVPGEIGNTKIRVSNLERARDQQDQANRPDTTFALGGLIYVSGSTPYPCPRRRYYREAVVALGTPLATGTLTVVINVDGNPAATIEVPAGFVRLIIGIDLEVFANQLVTAELTTVGTGGRDLTVALRT